jgi:arsenate reductase
MDSPTAPPAPGPDASPTPPPASPAGAPSTPSPAATPPTAAVAKRGLFSGRLDDLLQKGRAWLKLDDDTQVGFRVKGARVSRSKHIRMRLLFVDVGNSARSQIAEAHAQILGFHAESAGTFPSMRLQPEAVHVLREQGIDIAPWRPKPLDVNRLHAFDRVIVMSDALPRPWSREANVEHWNVMDPQGLSLDAYRMMRKDIERRLKAMARRHGVRPPPLPSSEGAVPA